MQLDVGRLFESMVSGLRSTGLRDADIARGANVSRSTVGRLGRGEGKNGSAECFIKLSAFYTARTGAPPVIRTTRR